MILRQRLCCCFFFALICVTLDTDIQPYMDNIQVLTVLMLTGVVFIHTKHLTQLNVNRHRIYVESSQRRVTKQRKSKEALHGWLPSRVVRA